MHRKTFFIFLLLSSCAANRIIETDLYFGMSKPDGGMISRKEWDQFKEAHISTIFKEGNTIIDATGNWRDPQSDKLITEPTHVVVYFHKNQKPISKQIDSLSNLYKTMFRQQSVLRVDKRRPLLFK